MFRSHVFRGTKFPQALRHDGKEDFGVSTTERAGIQIRVTNLERTLVDVLDRPNLSGSWAEIWRSLESIEFFRWKTSIRSGFLSGSSYMVH